MKMKRVIISGLALAATTTATISVINKLISMRAVEPSDRGETVTHIYKWRFGKIHYSVSGNGKPILLIHNCNSLSNRCEWQNLVDQLSSSRTVYSLDLIGCGQSEKPAFTYTNFLFVQLINDFVLDIIGKRTDVVSSGDSSAIALFSELYNQELFDKILLINPAPVHDFYDPTSKKGLFLKTLYNMPIYGTFSYFIATCKKNIQDKAKTTGMSNPNNIDPKYLKQMYLNAHSGGYPARFLYSSIKSHLTSMDVTKPLREINNSIYILGCSELDGMNDQIAEYKKINPAIETQLVEGARKMIALERPDLILEVIKYM